MSTGFDWHPPDGCYPTRTKYLPPLLSQDSFWSFGCVWSRKQKLHGVTIKLVWPAAFLTYFPLSSSKMCPVQSWSHGDKTGTLPSLHIWCSNPFSFPDFSLVHGRIGSHPCPMIQGNLSPFCLTLIALTPFSFQLKPRTGFCPHSRLAPPISSLLISSSYSYVLYTCNPQMFTQARKDYTFIWLESRFCTLKGWFPVFCSHCWVLCRGCIFSS